MLFYDMGGTLLDTQWVTLPAGARRDFPAHAFGRNQVGVIEWLPDDLTLPFRLRNVRYYYAVPDFSADIFMSAAQFDGQKATGSTVSVPLDGNGSSAIVEISNVSDRQNVVIAQVYRNNGQLAQNFYLDLAPHSSYHLIADSLLNGGGGMAVIQGSVVGGLVATGMHYGRDSGGHLLYMYGVQAQQALGATLRGSYNTFLNQGCRLKLTNPTAAHHTVRITMRRNDGTEVLGSGVTRAVPAKGLLDYDLCGNDVADVYGVVTVEPDLPNSVFGTIVRLGQNDQYRFPTSLRQ